MSRSGRYGRPGRLPLLAMMLANGILSWFVLHILFSILDVRDIPDIFGPRGAAWTVGLKSWDLLTWMLPGVGIGLGCLWFWLILVGRSRGVPWGGAFAYAVVIAFVNAPVSGLLIGSLHGNPFLGALIGLAVLLLQHSLLLALILYGILMGGLNGWLAERWIAARKGS